MERIVRFLYVFCLINLVAPPCYGVAVRKAVCCVPVADVLAASPHKFDIPTRTDTTGVTRYDIPCLYSNDIRRCPRAGQLLYNEQCFIIHENDSIACVWVPHMGYHTTDRASLFHKFWVNRADIRCVDEIGTCAATVPPIFYGEDDPATLVLLVPWYADQTGCTYSVGTRFMRCPEHDTASTYGVWINNFEQGAVVRAHVPRDDARVCRTVATENAFRELFVATLRRWTGSSDQTYIPYVWGGMSATQRIDTGRYQHDDGAWYHPDVDVPCTGFDCSGAILRGAQIANARYCMRNSHTLVDYLRPLTADEPVKSGDIMWYKGHVLVIADTVRNTIIESCGQSFGYGRLHEVPLSQRFEGVATCHDLEAAYRKQAPLYNKQADGTVKRKVDRFILFSLKSVWSGCENYGCMRP